MQAEPVRVFIVSDHPLVRDGLRPQVGDEITDVTASPYLSAVFGVGETTSFWKRGSFRSGSNIGSSRSSAGVSGGICPKNSLYSFGASEATIFSKRGSLRNGSSTGLILISN